MNRVEMWLIGCLLWGILVRHCPAAIPLNELNTPPTPERCKKVVDQALIGSWASISAELRDAAFASYRSGNLEAARAWLNLFKWARLLGTPEEESVRKWMATLESAHLVHTNLPKRFTLRPRVVLATWLSTEQQHKFTADGKFLDELFEELTPNDFLPGVLKSLADMRINRPRDFEEFPSLALAIALVYDEPPPPDWPHGQVSNAQLHRRFPRPEETLTFLTDQNRSKRTLVDLRKLSAVELKFVVDFLASFEDLRWAAQVVTPPLGQLESNYKAVRYRLDRLRNDSHNWPLPNYSLPLILSQGGICVDQAYFATQTAKARGVPTLLFCGSGRDGRHAWFGFLDEKRVWQLNAGRYAEQRFVTGIALDPQTWAPINDHTLQFMTEGFQHGAAARLSRIHAAFASEFLKAGERNEAKLAARTALRREKRNLDAFATMEEALADGEDYRKNQENLWREAIIAFARYPDLEATFSRKLVASMRERGERSAADAEEKRLITKYQGDRTDISIAQAAQILARSFGSDELPAQIRTYNQVLDQYGRGAGMSFFDGIVLVFVEHLVQLGQVADAQNALMRAKGVLRVEQGSQLESEFLRIQKKLR